MSKPDHALDQRVGCQNLDRLIDQRQFKQARVALRTPVKRGTRLIGVAAGAGARGDEDFDGVDVTARALRVACRIAWLGSREGPATSAQPRPRGLPLPVGDRNAVRCRDLLVS